MGMRTQFEPAGDNLAEKDRPSVTMSVASPDVLRLLGISVTEGRGLSPGDRYGHPYVALVNRKFSELYQQRVGALIRVKFWNGHMKPWNQFEVVGIVSDARNRDLEHEPEPGIYLSALQIPLDGAFYFVRTSLPASAISGGFRNAVWTEDPNLQKVSPRPLAPYVEKELESRRLAAWLIGVFAALAVLLATAGLGAGVSAWVTESQKEIGIRSALGEPAAGIAARVVLRSLRLSGLGMLAAVPLTLATVAGFRNQIAGIGKLRPGLVLIVVAVGCAVALLASLAPSWRAARLNPMDVLRRG
jgi:putative ABC transport system permease protein